MIIVSVFSFGCREKEQKQKVDTFDGVELTYYKMFDDSDVIEPIIHDYEAAHPGLKISYKKFSDFDEYQRVVLNEMAEGEGPDIFSMQNTWFASNFKKVSPMPETLGTAEDFSEIFADVAYNDLVRVDENGLQQVFALPMTIDTLALFYNKAQLEDRIPTRGKPSDTWEGIKEDVSFLNKTDNSMDRFEVSGIAMGRADNISRGVDILYLLFLQFGVDFYNDNISQAIFAGQQGGVAQYPGLEALNFFVSFADPEQKNYSWNEFIVDDDASEKEVEAFASGKVSMIAGFSYMFDDIVNQINILKSKGVKTIDESDIRIAPIPQIFDPDVSKDKRVTYANYFAETVSRNSKYPDVAWDFLIELTSKKNLEYYFKKLHKPTSRRDMIDDQKKDPVYGVFASQIGYAESFPIIDYFSYKQIFTKTVGDANLLGAAQGGLLEAQEAITRLLPEEGLIVSDVKEPAKDENDEAVDKKKEITEGDKD